MNLAELIGSISDLLWSMYFMVPVLFIGALYFSYKTKFVQFRLFKTAVKKIKMSGSHKTKKNEISSFQAFAIGVAARVGTGNMAGVAIALVVGGPGSIFWMWVMALLGGASAFIESTTAQLFKVYDSEVTFRGGPAYYIKNKLKRPKLAAAFAISLTFGYVYAMLGLQTNTTANAVANQILVFNDSANRTLILLIVGVVFASVTGYAIFSGTKKIAELSTYLVSIMTIVYFTMVGLVIILNISEVPGMISLIVSSALSPEALTGGAFGTIVSTGFRRGLVSNEAGQGTSANAAAAATTAHPASQGLIQALGVFTDTILVCSATAFAILLSGTELTGSDGIQITQTAFESTLGSFSSIILTGSLFFFAISTILGMYYYGQSNFEFLFGEGVGVKGYKITIIAFIFLSSVIQTKALWNFTDIATAIMALINVYALLHLIKYPLIALKDYEEQLANGIEDPVFDGSKYELTKDLEIWNQGSETDVKPQVAREELTYESPVIAK